MNNVAIIGARGGSKGIKDKNIIDFCGKPLIAWTIQSALEAEEIDSVWVTTDSEEIMNVSKEYGAEIVRRPDEISGDVIMPEPAWEHALDQIEDFKGPVDLAVFMQVTSPLRKKGDLSKGIKEFRDNSYDSLFSASKIDDIFFWEKDPKGALQSLNYDYKNRKRRQDFSPQFVENGSFYITTPGFFRKEKNRLGGKIGMTMMEFWQMFEIDTPDDLDFCKMLMKKYVLS